MAAQECLIGTYWI